MLYGLIGEICVSRLGQKLITDQNRLFLFRAKLKRWPMAVDYGYRLPDVRELENRFLSSIFFTRSSLSWSTAQGMDSYLWLPWILWSSNGGLFESVYFRSSLSSLCLCSTYRSHCTNRLQRQVPLSSGFDSFAPPVLPFCSLCVQRHSFFPALVADTFYKTNYPATDLKQSLWIKANNFSGF